MALDAKGRAELNSLIVKRNEINERINARVPLWDTKGRIDDPLFPELMRVHEKLTQVLKRERE